MAAAGMSLVWSPQSNVFLYGAGTTLTATANIPLAMSKGINIALAPDWSIGGSQNILDELRFADHVDNAAWGDQISPQELVKMVTTHAARALGLEAVLGSITVGKKADLMIIGGDITKPYEALLAASPADVRLVLVGGVPLYGDKVLQPISQASPGCEDLDICCQPKFACVATANGTATNKLGQTLGEIQSALSTSLTQYDALDLTQWDFAPLAPLVKCP
jgi:cytosine/adenosine deaminase-related metal-dependent hydrolase